jgi:hypothetical protein
MGCRARRNLQSKRLNDGCILDDVLVVTASRMACATPLRHCSLRKRQIPVLTGRASEQGKARNAARVAQRSGRKKDQRTL